MTPSVIEPATFRFVAQHKETLCYGKIEYQFKELAIPATAVWIKP
jgi:hypothetical protein